MVILRLLPVFLCFLLLSAHFLRAYQTFIALFSLLAPGLLFFPRPWSVRTIKILLLFASAEWLRTMVQLVQLRVEMDAPWTRMAIILSLIAITTCASTLLFRQRAVKKHYGLPG